MKRTISLAWVVFLAVAAGVAQQKGATIVFDSQSKDFGRVLEGEPLKHVFKFSNRGSGTLEILNIEKP
jgi:hypothetical protein